MATNISCIPVQKAIASFVVLSKEAGLPHTESKAFDLLIKSIPSHKLEDGTLVMLTQDIRDFISNWIRAVREKDFSFLYQSRGLRVGRIVDIEEFAESKEYFNQKGYIRPKIKYELQRLFETDGDPYVEAVLTGAIGIGKNYFGDLAIGYMVYVLSCFHNPQLEHDLAPGSSIVFIQQSITQTLAKKVVFGQFAERLKLSPYFQKYFPYDPKVMSELRFPKNIYVYPVGGSDTGAIGMNVYGGVIDELNFMAKTQDSVRTRLTHDDEYDQAERVYSALIRRMKSRFLQKGKLPGKLLLISSVHYPGDFTDRKIKEAETDKTIFVMKYAQWEVLPANRFCGDTFLVEVGNELKQTRIVEHVLEATDEDDVINIPIEYKAEFERDIEAAMRDLAGIATGTRHPFIPYREKIEQAQLHFEETFGGQLFKVNECVIDRIVDLNAPDFWELVNPDYLKNNIVDTTHPFAVHIDVGISNDAAGLGIGRIVGYKLLPATKFFNEKTGEFVELKDIRAPIYQIDGLLRIKAPPNGEVDLELVRDLVLWLRGELYIKWGTMDSYQSTMMIQAFKKARIRAGVLSVDTSVAPYTEVKLAIKDERLFIPRHPTLAQELREVEKTEKGKIDHPAGGCFIKQTRVALLNGTNPTFGQLRKQYGSTEPFWLYGISEIGLRASLAINPRVTRTVDVLLEITLDNYQIIYCTLDHLFLTLDGQWIEAQEINQLTRLMPLKRRVAPLGGWGGYERITCPITGERLLTHQMVGKQLLGERDRNFILHHKDHIKLNNDPSNIEWKTKAKHASLHTSWRHENDPVWVQKLRKGHELYRESGGNQKSRDNMNRLIREGIINPKRRGMRSSDGRNHSAINIKIVELSQPVEMWDLTTIDAPPVFSLTAGVFVHNSKDVADAVAGVVYMLQTKEATYGRPVSHRRGNYRGDTADNQVGRIGVRKVRLSSGRKGMEGRKRF